MFIPLALSADLWGGHVPDDIGSVSTRHFQAQFLKTPRVDLGGGFLRLDPFLPPGEIPRPPSISESSVTVNFSISLHHGRLS